MIGESDPQRALFYQLSLESFVPAEHPLRRIRPLIDDRAIRRVCRLLYSEIGRPSIPPEQLSWRCSAQSAGDPESGFAKEEHIHGRSHLRGC
jgi:hypothetical protein